MFLLSSRFLGTAGILLHDYTCMVSQPRKPENVRYISSYRIWLSIFHRASCSETHTTKVNGAAAYENYQCENVLRPDVVL